MENEQLLLILMYEWLRPDGPYHLFSRQFHIYEVNLAEAFTSWAPVFWVRCAFGDV